MIKLYRHALSGHAHRVELMMSLLGLNYELIDVDLLSGAHKKATFLTKTPFGQVPVIEDEEITLWDSNAILVYLAKKYGALSWLPDDAKGAADVQAWLSIAASEIAYGPAAARLVTVFGASLDHEAAKDKANALFATMDDVLAKRDFLTGKTVTIADVAGYSYIAHAPEGGVSLAPYPHIKEWLARIEVLDGFVAMTTTPVSLAA